MAKAPKVRTVKNKEDRKRPSVFLRLKTDEQFRGHALFEPDMELADNPGFYEYFSHWDQQGNRYVPCAGDQCPFCLANDNPMTQASTLWYFPENDVKDRFKVFTMNFGTIQDITDISEEEEGVLGKKFRIKRMSDRGEYRIRPLTDKPLKSSEIKKLLKDAPDLEKIIQDNLKKEWDRLKAMDALADEDDEDDTDDDDDEEETKDTKKGKSKPKDEEEDDSDDDDDDDDDEDENDDDDEEDDDDSDDDDDESDDDDEEEEDDEEDDDDEEEDDDDSDDDDENESVEGVDFEVVKANEDDENIDVKDSDGKKATLFVGQGLEPKWAEIKKGVTITVDALKDDEGDYVMTALKVKKARGSSKGKAAPKGKGKAAPKGKGKSKK